MHGATVKIVIYRYMKMVRC